jgi:uncharacterized membrane protein YdfJ with MMPL/SSD domain
MTTSGSSSSSSSNSNSRSNGGEIQAQYMAQVDVLDLLGRKVQSLLDNSSTATTTATATARTKLARDFDRVRAQAHNLQERVSRFQKATGTSAGAAGGSSSSGQRNNATSADDYHQQVQVQLHQDVRGLMLLRLTE